MPKKRSTKRPTKKKTTKKSSRDGMRESPSRARPAAKLTVKKVKVAVGAVTVQHLMLKDRKLTMAMFRQIKHECMIDIEKGVELGTVWGHVNYWFEQYKYERGSKRRKKDGYRIDEPESLHVLWQKGDELRLFVMKQDMTECDVDSHLVIDAMVELEDRVKWDRTFAVLKWLESHDEDDIDTGRFDEEAAWFLLGKAGLLRPVADTRESKYEFREQFVRPRPMMSLERWIGSIGYASVADISDDRKHEIFNNYDVYREEFYGKQSAIDQNIADAIRAIERERNKYQDADAIRKKIKRYIDSWKQLYDQIAKTPQFYIATG